MSENISGSPARKRGRPPKNPTGETKTTNGIKKTQETNNIANEFCSFQNRENLSTYYFGLNIFNYFSREELRDIISNPIEHNDILRKVSLMLYSGNGVYTNTVDYMTAMPTLDKVIVTHGENSRRKKSNKDKMESTLRVIKDKEIVRDALFKGMIEGVAFYYFETTERPLSNQKYMSDYDVDRITEINEFGINASVISLPPDYTRIVGIKNSSYVLAFDLNYFTDCTGESEEKKLRKYPKEIRDAYREKGRGKVEGGNWVVLDNTKTIVHKIRSKRDEKWGRPIVLAAITDILYDDYFTDTKRNVLDEINNRVVYQTFPEGKDKGTSALNKTQQGHQHEVVKKAIMDKNNRGGTSFFSVAAGTKIDKIDPTNTDIFDDSYESDLDDKVALDLGFAASLLNGTGSGNYSSQQNNLDLLASQLFQWIEQIESEINKCISKNIIKDERNWVECRYLPITNVNKSKMVGYMKDLYLQGKGSLTLWASACGISSDIFFALLNQELEEDIENKYPVHQTSYTLSSNSSDNTGGRPVDEDTENPSTMQTRASGSNLTPAPSKEE